MGLPNTFKAYEIEFRTICDKLVKSIGLSPLSTQTPFSDLLEELDQIFKISDNSTKRSYKIYAEQSLQAIEQLLARPLYSTIGTLLLPSLPQSIAFRSSMVNRWKDSTSLLQTPVIDFLFRLGQDASTFGLRTPMLQAVLWSLKSREIVDLRNGLTHSCYSWIDNPKEQSAINIMDRRELNAGKTVRILQADVCEAFHGLICICLMALRQFSIKIIDAQQ